MHAFRTYIFDKAYPLQRGLPAIAGLLIFMLSNSRLLFCPSSIHLFLSQYVHTT